MDARGLQSTMAQRWGVRLVARTSAASQRHDSCSYYTASRRTKPDVRRLVGRLAGWPRSRARGPTTVDGVTRESEDVTRRLPGICLLVS